MLKKALVSEVPNQNKITFCSYGINVQIKLDEKNHRQYLLKKIPELLANNLEFVEAKEYDLRFHLKKVENGFFKLYKNEELFVPKKINYNEIVGFLLVHLRLIIAEQAESKVFIHAGVVGVDGKALIFPAKSFGGKTTLVTEFIKNGAEYYSDEYAVLDQDGLVHPYSKMLSIRGFLEDNQQIDIPVEKIGGKKGTKPIPVGWVLFTEYEKGSKWEPEMLTQGKAVLEILQHALSIRYNPKFTLKVLNKTLENAIIAKSIRGDAANFVKSILKFVEK